MNETAASPDTTDGAGAAAAATGTGGQEDRRRRTVSSALWAAWADALGFISELTPPEGLRRRLNGGAFTDPVGWTRRIGGKYGPSLALPAGCYSDDTQLRLSTGRAVSAHGFDVEAFSRIELPVWQAYALGGGRASRSAATGFTKARVAWFANFYKGWQDSGGNGVAMRIQPHVWASPDLSGTDYIRDTLVNGVTSHGHPRALVGAVLHAHALAFGLREHRTPDQQDYQDLLAATRTAISTFDTQPDLATFWRPEWERTTGLQLSAAWESTVNECQDQLIRCKNLGKQLTDTVEQNAAQALYQQIIGELDLSNRQVVGSGTATVVASLLLASARPTDPADAARIASRALGTDTDTIATMAAALIGAGSAATPPSESEILDGRYLHEEATRLADLALGQQTTDFRYPDLLHWTPPSSALECVGLWDDQLVLAGISFLHPSGETTHTKDTDWQWMTTTFGASVLVKRRARPKTLPPGNRPVPSTRAAALSTTASSAPTAVELSGGPQVDAAPAAGDPFLPVFEDSEPAPSALAVTRHATYPRQAEQSAVKSEGDEDRRGFGAADAYGHLRPVDVDVVLAWVVKSAFSDQAVGYAVNQVAHRGTVEQLIALTIAIRIARTDSPAN